MERIQLSTDEVDGVAVARLEGSWTSSIEKARSRLDPLAGGGKLVVDLDRVTFIDSAGLHALFGSARPAAPRREQSHSRSPTPSPTARVIQLVHLSEDAGVADRRGGGRRPHGLRFGAPRTTVVAAARREEVALATTGRDKGIKARPSVRAHQGVARGSRRAARGGDRRQDREQGACPLGEARKSSRLSRTDISSGRRGGIRANRKGPRGRTKDQLYEEAGRPRHQGPLEDDGTAAARRHTQAKLSAGETRLDGARRRAATVGEGLSRTAAWYHYPGVGGDTGRVEGPNGVEDVVFAVETEDVSDRVTVVEVHGQADLHTASTSARR